MPELQVRVEEVAAEIFQIHVGVPPSVVGIPGGFSFNQYLVGGDEPLLFHTGPRAMAPLVKRGIEKVLPLASLRYVAFSHCESDECGSMNELLAAAPRAVPVTGKIGMMLNGDLFDRQGLSLGEGEVLQAGDRRFRWLDASHLPHGWECGYLFEEKSRTLLCGDLFTQPGFGDATPHLTRGDVLGPAEAMRASMDYFALSPATGPLLEKLATTRPGLLACMHGSAWEGDGAKLLGELQLRLETSIRERLRPPPGDGASLS